MAADGHNGTHLDWNRVRARKCEFYDGHVGAAARYQMAGCQPWSPPPRTSPIVITCLVLK